MRRASLFSTPQRPAARLDAMSSQSYAVEGPSVVDEAAKKRGFEIHKSMHWSTLKLADAGRGPYGDGPGSAPSNLRS
jgi:hypothetical protein